MAFPSLIPVLDTRGRYLRTGLHINRASAKRVFGAAGTLITVPANTPAWDCDPLSGAERGLLVEEQRTNLLSHSEQFDNAAWSHSNGALTANAATAPDGNATADKLVEGTSTSVPTAYQFISGLTAGAVYTASIFVKAAGRSVGRVLFVNSSANAGVGALFDLTGGTVNTAAYGGTVTGATITSVGNGWYRISIAGSLGAHTNGGLYLDIGGATGDGTSGLYLWGAQLEAGPFPTSYIPTTGAPVTRAADVATVALSDISGFNAAAFTLSATCGLMALPVGDNACVFAADAGDTNLVSAYAEVADTGLVRARTYVGGTYSGGVTASLPITMNGSVAFASRFKASDFGISLGGAAAVTGAVPMPASLTTMRLGSKSSGSYVNGWLRRVSVYPRGLANADLQALTA